MAFKIKLKDLIEQLEAVIVDRGEHYQYPKTYTCFYGGPDEAPDSKDRCIYGEALARLGWKYDPRIEKAGIRVRLTERKLIELEDKVYEHPDAAELLRLIVTVQSMQDAGDAYGTSVKDAVNTLKKRATEMGLLS